MTARMAFAILALCWTARGQDAPTIEGPATAPRDKIAEFKLANADPAASAVWKSTPKGRLDIKLLANGNRGVAGPPGSYTLVVTVIQWEARKYDEVEFDFVISGAPDPAPQPDDPIVPVPPSPPAPPKPNPEPGTVAARVQSAVALIPGAAAMKAEEGRVISIRYRDAAELIRGWPPERMNDAWAALAAAQELAIPSPARQDQWDPYWFTEAAIYRERKVVTPAELSFQMLLLSSTLGALPRG